MHLTIRNFMGIEELDQDFTAPLNVIVGPNEAGKSTIRDAFPWGFTGHARGLKTHTEQSALIREGTKSAEVTISLDGTHAFTRRKTQKSNATVMGEIPTLGLSPAILFDPYTFLMQSEADRRELLFKVIPGLNPTEQNVFDRIIRWPAVETITSDGGMPPSGPIRAIAKMAASYGFPGAEKEAIENRKAAKRIQKEYEGATAPEKTITIDGKEYDIPTLNLPAIEALLKELQTEKDNLLRQKGAAEARVRRIEKIQNQLGQIAVPDPPHPDEIPTLQERLRVNKEALEANAQEIAQATVKNQTFPVTCPAITLEQIPCPKTGQIVGAEPPAAGVLEALTQNRQGLIKQGDEITTALHASHQWAENSRIAAEKKANLEEELVKLQAEPETSIADLDAEISIHQQRLDRGQVFRLAIANYNTLQAQFQITQEKLTAAKSEIALYDALAKALASDGIPSQMIAEALDGINELLEEAAAHLFSGRYLHLTGELGIVLQSSPYVTLSKSAKYRVGVAFQYALAKLTGARLLLIDEADILDDPHRSQLIEFLLAHLTDFDQIMVFMTNEAPILPVVEGQFHSWWLEDGHIRRVA